MKLLPYFLFEKYITILALEMPAQGTSTMPIISAEFRSLMQTICTSLRIDNHTNTSSLNFYKPAALSDVQPTVSKH